MKRSHPVGAFATRCSRASVAAFALSDATFSFFSASAWLAEAWSAFRFAAADASRAEASADSARATAAESAEELERAAASAR